MTSGTHLCKKVGTLKNIWGTLRCIRPGRHKPHHPGPPSNPHRSLWRFHKNPARMLMSKSHPTAMLASAGAPSGNCRQFLCLYASEARQAGNMVQLNVCPRRVQLPGLGLACLFVSLFSAPPPRHHLPGSPWGPAYHRSPQSPIHHHLCPPPHCLVPERSSTHPEYVCGTALPFFLGGGCFCQSLLVFSWLLCQEKFLLHCMGGRSHMDCQTVISEEAGQAG